MTDNSKKLSEIPQASNVASTDRVLVLRDPSGNASTRTVTVGNLAASISSFSNSISVGNYSINSYASSLNFNVDAFVLSNTENANGGFKWYSGNNELVKIERDGHLVVNRIRSRLYANLELYSDGLAGNWKFANDGILYLPNTVGDIYKDGVSVLGAANTGNITFSNTVISLNSDADMFINNPNNAIQIGAKTLVQMSATEDANNLWGSGNVQSYAWVYRYNDYAEFGTWVQANNKVAEIYNTTDPNHVFFIDWNDGTGLKRLNYNANGQFDLPANGYYSVGGVPVLGNVTFSNTSYYSGQQITSADPLILRGNNYVTSVINDKNDGFAELWWHNRDFDSGNASNNTPVDADLYVDNNGMWLWAGGLDNSNTYYFHQWHWGMDGMLDIPSGGDIRRDGVSVIGTGQIDGGNAFTTPTAEITVDGGGA